MAQLNNTIVNGILRASTGAFNTIKDSTGSTGTSGQVLTSNGTNIVWGTSGDMTFSQLKLANSNGTITTLVASASTNVTYKFPSSVPTANSFMAMDTNGLMQNIRITALDGGKASTTTTSDPAYGTLTI